MTRLLLKTPEMTIDLPDVRHVYISGMNGCGKTHVVNALHTAVYGVGTDVGWRGSAADAGPVILKQLQPGYDVVIEDKDRTRSSTNFVASGKFDTNYFQLFLEAMKSAKDSWLLRAATDLGHTEHDVALNSLASRLKQVSDKAKKWSNVVSWVTGEGSRLVGAHDIEAMQHTAQGHAAEIKRLKAQIDSYNKSKAQAALTTLTAGVEHAAWALHGFEVLGGVPAMDDGRLVWKLKNGTFTSAPSTGLWVLASVALAREFGGPGQWFFLPDRSYASSLLRAIRIVAQDCHVVTQWASNGPLKVSGFENLNEDYTVPVAPYDEVYYKGLEEIMDEED